MNDNISYIPAREGNAHIILPLSLFLLGFAAMYTSSLQGIYSLPFQLIGIGLIAAGILITTRFSLCFYEYAILLRDDGRSILRITRLQGQSRRVVCFAPLSGIKAMSVDKNADFSKYGKNIPIHSFCVNVFPKNTALLLLDRSITDDMQFAPESDVTECAIVKLECGEEFISAIKRYSGVE